jgi:hypothetical protein
MFEAFSLRSLYFHFIVERGGVECRPCLLRAKAKGGVRIGVGLPGASLRGWISLFPRWGRMVGRAASGQQGCTVGIRQFPNALGSAHLSASLSLPSMSLMSL